LRNGDTMLLCSDGLWGSLSVSEEQIDDAVAEIQKAIQRAGKLVSK
jgi:serine/threonine protein phosphatase PrpC